MGSDSVWTVGGRGLIILWSLKYKRPQWEGEGRIRANSWVHTPVPRSGAYAGEVARCSERDGDRSGAQPCPLGVTRGEGPLQVAASTLEIHPKEPPANSPAMCPAPRTPSFDQRLTR